MQFCVRYFCTILAITNLYLQRSANCQNILLRKFIEWEWSYFWGHTSKPIGAFRNIWEIINGFIRVALYSTHGTILLALLIRFHPLKLARSRSSVIERRKYLNMKSHSNVSFSYLKNSSSLFKMHISCAVSENGSNGSSYHIVLNTTPRFQETFPRTVFARSNTEIVGSNPT
jgi:hypothetical protein